jgi:hypothetical protein
MVQSVDRFCFRINFLKFYLVPPKAALHGKSAEEFQLHTQQMAACVCINEGVKFGVSCFETFEEGGKAGNFNCALACSLLWGFETDLTSSRTCPVSEYGTVGFELSCYSSRDLLEKSISLT